MISSMPTGCRMRWVRTRANTSCRVSGRSRSRTSTSAPSGSCAPASKSTTLSFTTPLQIMISWPPPTKYAESKPTISCKFLQGIFWWSWAVGNRQYREIKQPSFSVSCTENGRFRCHPDLLRFRYICLNAPRYHTLRSVPEVHLGKQQRRLRTERRRLGRRGDGHCGDIRLGTVLALA